MYSYSSSGSSLVDIIGAGACLPWKMKVSARQDRPMRERMVLLMGFSMIFAILDLAVCLVVMGSACGIGCVSWAVKVRLFWL